MSRRPGESTADYKGRDPVAYKMGEYRSSDYGSGISYTLPTIPSYPVEISDSQGGGVRRSMFDGPFEKPSMSWEEAFNKVCMDVLKGLGIVGIVGVGAALLLYKFNSNFRQAVDQKIDELLQNQPAAE
ncbi:MAG TPA: hypothetical protein VFY83_06240 [Anaerolineales bacterium]|nr:hypothetical protein [Anaerolineales bacterium]